MRTFNGEVSIVLCGEAGQGIQSIETILTRSLKLAGYHVFAAKEYMSRVRGGSNSTTIRVSENPVQAFSERIDLLIPLDQEALPHLKKRISSETILIGEREKLDSPLTILDLPLSRIAAGLGNPIYANIAAAGMLCALLNVELEILSSFLGSYFSKKAPEIIQKNIEAARKGYEIGKTTAGSQKIEVRIRKDPALSEELFLNGAGAIALGALAGGCDFISAYPMTPSTGIFTFLAGKAREFGLIAEQAEDEISAINMAVGASYAGGRPLVTTAGGGFALMVEGLSLAGMLETPVVIVIGQRPAPATGLPTRTEQADMMFALNAGHGEFPRVLLAPGTIGEAFDLTRRAFNMADRFQSPVIILTDQYQADSYHNVPPFDSGGFKVEKTIIETTEDYRRYRVTGDGISPRGLPGFGKGLVCLDSDEHDEEGHITEDEDVRAAMVEKRLRKMELIRREALPPTLSGPEDYKYLVISWGSTFGVVQEAIFSLGLNDLAHLHFSQIFPLHPDAGKFLEKAENTIIIENNATAQLARLLRQETGCEMSHRILKYNGLPFSIEEVRQKLQEILHG